MEPLDKERVDEEEDAASAQNPTIAFGAIPIFAILGAVLAILAGLVSPSYAAAFFGVAVLLGLGAAAAWVFGGVRRTRV